MKSCFKNELKKWTEIPEKSFQKHQSLRKLKIDISKQSRCPNLKTERKSCNHYEIFTSTSILQKSSVNNENENERFKRKFKDSKKKEKKRWNDEWNPMILQNIELWDLKRSFKRSKKKEKLRSSLMSNEERS